MMTCVQENPPEVLLLSLIPCGHSVHISKLAVNAGSSAHTNFPAEFPVFHAAEEKKITDENVAPVGWKNLLTAHRKRKAKENLSN